MVKVLASADGHINGSSFDGTVNFARDGAVVRTWVASQIVGRPA